MNGRPAGRPSTATETLAVPGDDARNGVERLLLSRVEALAGDVGRLRRRLDGETDDGFLVHLICGHVETLHAILSPNAADYYRGNRAFGVSEGEAVAEAIASVDAHTRKVRDLLGMERP